MFFYEIRVTRRRKVGTGKRTSTTTEYMEALKPEYVGEKVASHHGKREVVRVTTEAISQAKYVRKTRRG